MILVNYFNTSLILIKIITRFIINNGNITVPVVYSVKFLRWKNLVGVKKPGKSTGRGQNSWVIVLVGGKRVGEKFGRV